MYILFSPPYVNVSDSTALLLQSPKAPLLSSRTPLSSHSGRLSCSLSPGGSSLSFLSQGEGGWSSPSVRGGYSGVDCLKCLFHCHPGMKTCLGLEFLHWKLFLENVRSRFTDVSSLLRNSGPFLCSGSLNVASFPAGSARQPLLSTLAGLSLPSALSVWTCSHRSFKCSSSPFLFFFCWVGPPIFFLSCFPACWLSVLTSGIWPPLSSAGCLHFSCRICELPRAVPGPSISELWQGTPHRLFQSFQKIFKFF